MHRDVPYVPPKEIDDDVEEEMIRVENTKASEYAIKVDKIRKVYRTGGGRKKVAVDRVSFGIKNGECFALLGVNGAGKTTTFKMLTGEIGPTAGEAYINGYKIPSQMGEARKYIGYCPQFDALLENLTAKEHLELYAAIKGIPLDKREAMIQKQLHDLNLKPFENICAGTYSGGNKRKLSVAMAMIGNPPIVFLDEPSNGMDPEARRFMWDVISRISTERKHSSVILTTHSMEEAEALATKMAIQVEGNLRCIGSSQHIKTKYGGGYEIEIKLNLPTKDDVSAFLKSLKYNESTKMNKEEVAQLLQRAKAIHLQKEITPDGVGAPIYYEIQKGSVSADYLAEWILIERNGELVHHMLQERFTGVTLIEHFQSFYRYSIDSNISIGKVFGMFEDNKKQMNIMQYSVRQSTIEQIFNSFATGAMPVRRNRPTQTQNKEIALNIQPSRPHSREKLIPDNKNKQIRRDY